MIGLTLQIVPLALGVAASPLPIAAVLVILLGDRARIGGPAFLGWWVLANAVAIAVTTYFAGRLPEPIVGIDLMAEGAFTVILGIGLLAVAAISKRSRGRSDDPTIPPRWVRAVSNLSPVGGAFIALSNATTAPKNIALAIAAGLLIARQSGNTAEAIAAAVLYVAAASVSIAVPVALYFLKRESAEKVLARWRDIVTLHAAAAMEIVMGVVGVAMTVTGLLNLVG